MNSLSLSIFHFFTPSFSLLHFFPPSRILSSFHYHIFLQWPTVRFSLSLSPPSVPPNLLPYLPYSTVFFSAKGAQIQFDIDEFIIRLLGVGQPGQQLVKTVKEAEILHLCMTVRYEDIDRYSYSTLSLNQIGIHQSAVSH